MPEIDYRDGHFVRDGRPLFVIGVDYQYYRDRRDRWEKHLRLLQAAHCNVVTFYVPWRHHLVADGELDFSGRSAPNRDVVGLLRLCADLGLLAIAKPGPFVHSELNLGGLPNSSSPGFNPAIEPARGHDGEPLLWGYDQGQLPSSEDPTFDAMARQWLEAVGRELAPFQAPNGPLIAVQLNDETLYCTANAPPWTLGYEDPAMAQYREHLRQRHGDIAAYNSRHGTAWTSFDEVAAPVLGDQPSRPEQLLQYVDWGDFQWRLRRDSYQRYKCWLGLDVPALSNHAGITPPIEENVPDQAPEAADQVPAEYQDLYADWWLATNRVDADADVYEYGMISWLGVAAYGIADPRTTELPPADARNEVFQRYVNTAARRRGINMEENWGFAKLYHPFSRHPLVPVFQTLLSVAAGCSGYVVFCGVQHDHWDDDLDRVTKRGWPTFPSDAPITPDGETTPLYDAMTMLNAWFAREGDAWLEAERQRDLCWLIDPAAASTIFNHGINDPNNPDVIRIQQELEATLRQRVGAGLITINNAPFTTINTTRPTPLRPDRLARVPGVSYALSRLIYRDLKEAGAIDTRDMVQTGAIRVVQSNAIFNLDTQQISDIKSQLTLLQAGHAVNSNDNDATLGFFELHR